MSILSPIAAVFGGKNLFYVGQASGVPGVVGAALGPNRPKFVYTMVSWSAGANSRTLDSQTVDGVAMTRMLRAVDSSNPANMELWKSNSRVTPATGDVVSTFSGSGATGVVAVFWSDYDLSLTDSGVLSADGSSTTSFAGAARTDKGFLIAGARWASSGLTAAWSASEGITEIEDSSGKESFAWANPTTVASSTNVFVTHSSTTTARRMIVAALA